MGVWGPGIFSDDLACDVRDDFRDFIGNGASPSEATDRLVSEYGPKPDDTDGPVFWLALAATQWRMGRLEDSVRAEALRIIDEGEDLRRWEAEGRPTEARKRQKALAELRARLEQPPPAPRPVRLPYVQESNFQVGEVVRYSLASGRHALLRVVGLHVDKGGSCPEVEVIDWHDESIPDPAELARLPRLIPLRGGVPRPTIYHMIFRRSKTDFPADRLEVVAGDVPVNAIPRSSGIAVTWWKELDRVLEEGFGLT